MRSRNPVPRNLTAHKKSPLRALACLCAFVSPVSAVANDDFTSERTSDDGTPYLLAGNEVSPSPHHTEHLMRFGVRIEGMNRAVLAAIDRVQAHAMDGGGYYVGEGESPLPYPIALWGETLLQPPRSASYCSGATYGAFIEALNLLPRHVMPDATRREAFHMQETDGGRREDFTKFWGKWNANDFGAHYALHQYSGMGDLVAPGNLRPGDFVNIAWKTHGGHMVVFLGWRIVNGVRSMHYWSSQKGTNGMGDDAAAVSRIKFITAARLAHLEKMATFDVDRAVVVQTQGEPIGSDFPAP